MVKEIRLDKKAVFLCEECDLGYADKETAQRCEKWCSETKSCSLEITRKAIYFPYFLYQKSFAIGDIIQTSTPINPGNSGGPLLNYVGGVVGITTAIVQDFQGLGFAIPSNTIRREIESLVSSGTYRGHSYLGVMGTNMNYETAQQLGVNVTYGWKIVVFGDSSPARDGGTQIGDTIIALNGSRISNGDDLATYLEENTLPGEALILTVVRGNLQTNVTVTLGERSSPPVWISSFKKTVVKEK